MEIWEGLDFIFFDSEINFIKSASLVSQQMIDYNDFLILEQDRAEPLVQLKCTNWHLISVICQFQSHKISLFLQSYSRERKILSLESITGYDTEILSDNNRIIFVCRQKINFWYVIEKMIKIRTLLKTKNWSFDIENSNRFHSSFFLSLKNWGVYWRLIFARFVD